MKKKLHFVLFGLVFLAFSCENFQWNKKPNSEKPWTESSQSKPATVPWKGQAVAADTFITIARQADLGVVNIGTTQIIKQKRRPHFLFGPEGSPFEEFFGDDLFRRFFGEPNIGDAPDIKQQSLGSGFILTEQGLIVTNNHVVEKADEITVTIGNDQEYKAKLVGADPKTDVALIKVEPKEKLTPLALGDSDQLQVGEIVVAIGNPFGLSHTVTQGIVSAKERTIGFGPYDNFIQTDASINPGNSGGPLLNLKAEVIGINTAIVASSQGQGIGFAIPINLAKNIVVQLKEKGSVTRGWLGVIIQKVDPDLAKSLGLKDKRGALVSSVQKGSPAEKVGIRPRDVIVKVDDKEIRDFNELPRYIANLPVGKKVTIEILRDGKQMTVNPTIGELKPQAEERATSQQEEEESTESQKPDRLGLRVKTLTDRDARRLGLDTDIEGVLVTGVDPSSPAGQKGIRVNDVIVELNKVKVENVETYRKLSKSLSKGDTILLLVKRGGDATVFVAFTL